MPKYAMRIFTLLAMVAALLVAPSSPTSAKDGVAKRAATGQLPAVQINVSAPPGGPNRASTAAVVRTLPNLSPALVQSAADDIRAEEADAASGANTGGVDLGVSARTLGCRARNGDSNVRVNQDCTFRRQAEEIIKFNPADPQNLIAGQNDSRIGFNKCGFDYSFNGGKTWGDGIPPAFQHLNNPAGQETGVRGDPNRNTILGGPGTLHTYDAGSDPALAFDSQGRAFYSCVMFDINSNASGLYVTEAPQGAGGAFYNNIPAAGRPFIVAEDNNPNVFHDKNFIAADIFAASPNRDNVYVTWTVFRFDPKCGVGPNPDGIARYCSSPIFGAMSTDHALTWSTPEEISGSSNTLCFFGNALDPTRPASACDFDQGSDPIVRPDGSLVVTFNNGNTAADNPNGQQLAVRCSPSGKSESGTAKLHCAAPSKVGDDVTVGEPQCNFGRGPEECIPGAFIRTNDFPRIAVDRGNGDLFVTWQDYHTGEFDIQLSQSTDGGLTWTEAKAPANPDRAKDHYQPAIDVVPSTGENGDNARGNTNGDHVAISYYRTDRVPNENTSPTSGFAPGQDGVQKGSSNYYLAGGRGLVTPYADARVSPNFPPPDGIQIGFNGDYSGLVVVDGRAHPIWSDTRNVSPPGQNGAKAAHDEDIFTDDVRIPDGKGEHNDG